MYKDCEVDLELGENTGEYRANSLPKFILFGLRIITLLYDIWRVFSHDSI